MWTHAWDYMWGLGAGTGEEPTSCLSYITNFLFPVIFLTMCLFPASFSRNFPCAHNLCCLVSVSRRLSRITFAHQGEGIWTSAICDTYIFFKLSTEILFSFIITPWPKGDIKGSNEKSYGWEWREEEAQMVPRVLDDWIMLRSLCRGDWSCSNYLLLWNKTPHNLVELKLQPFYYVLSVVDRPREGGLSRLLDDWNSLGQGKFARPLTGSGCFPGLFTLPHVVSAGAWCLARGGWSSRGWLPGHCTLHTTSHYGGLEFSHSMAVSAESDFFPDIFPRDLGGS